MVFIHHQMQTDVVMTVYQIENIDDYWHLKFTTFLWFSWQFLGRLLVLLEVLINIRCIKKVMRQSLNIFFAIFLMEVLKPACRKKLLRRPVMTDMVCWLWRHMWVFETPPSPLESFVCSHATPINVSLL